MPPSYQGLHSHNAACTHIAFWLQIECEFSVLQSSLHLRKHQMFLFHSLHHNRIIPAHPVCIISLYHRHRNRSPVIYHAGGHGFVRDLIHAKGRQKPGIPSVLSDKSQNAVLHAVQICLNTGNQKTKIILPQITGQPAVFITDLSQTLCEIYQKFIPRLFPIPLIKQLKMFNIHGRKAIPFLPRVPQKGLHCLKEFSFFIESGERMNAFCASFSCFCRRHLMFRNISGNNNAACSFPGPIDLPGTQFHPAL